MKTYKTLITLMLLITSCVLRPAEVVPQIVDLEFNLDYGYVSVSSHPEWCENPDGSYLEAQGFQFEFLNEEALIIKHITNNNATIELLPEEPGFTALAKFGTDQLSYGDIFTFGLIGSARSYDLLVCDTLRLTWAKG